MSYTIINADCNTGVACLELGRYFVGIELNKEYYELAEKRLREAVSENAILRL